MVVVMLTVKSHLMLASEVGNIDLEIKIRPNIIRVFFSFFFIS